MQVELIVPTPETVQTQYRGLIWLAARTCYSPKTPQSLWKSFLAGEIPDESVMRTIQHVVSSGHHSVLEHLNFTFAVSGVSRVLTHQLARHRHISLSQQSQRYVGSHDAELVIPPSVAKHPHLEPLWRTHYENYIQLKQHMQEAGIEPEDIRFFAPQGQTTNFLMTANLRALVDICKLRLCTLAQWEIRKLFKEIRKTLGRIDPIYYQILTIKCVWHGYCDEERNKNGWCKIRPYRPAKSVELSHSTPTSEHPAGK